MCIVFLMMPPWDDVLPVRYSTDTMGIIGGIFVLLRSLAPAKVTLLC